MGDYKIYTPEEVRAMTEAEKKAAKVSKWFTVWEVECHCGCGEARVQPQQLAAMDALRDHIKAPLYTRWGVGGGSGSVCRCVAHNKEIDGAPKSYHVGGFACDCRAPGYTVHELATAALAIPAFKQGGIGIYPRGGKRGWAHLDCRQTGAPARWQK